MPAGTTHPPASLNVRGPAEQALNVGGWEMTSFSASREPSRVVTDNEEARKGACFGEVEPESIAVPAPRLTARPATGDRPACETTGPGSDNQHRFTTSRCLGRRYVRPASALSATSS